MKEKKKITHQASTQSIFKCLSYMPQWSNTLLKHGSPKSYKEFLQWLLTTFTNDEIRYRMTIKKVADGFNSTNDKVKKWIHEIYNDIIELNIDQPALFRGTDLNVELYMRHYDDACTLTVSLPVLPRLMERFSFPFIEAKVGTNNFWVKEIQYDVEDDNTKITVWLHGGTPNFYRELALAQALFEGKISFMDIYKKSDFEIDNEIKRIYSK